MISVVEVIPLTIPLRRVYKTSRVEQKFLQQVFVKITDSSGKVGVGEGAIREDITGETLNGVVDIIQNRVVPLIQDCDPLDREVLMSLVDNVLEKNSTARCVIDIALHDIAGKILGIPVYKLLGGAYRKTFSFSKAVILGDSVENTVKEAKRLTNAGYGILKIKAGKDCDTDILRVKKIREACGSQIEIRVDANGGWPVEEAIKAVKAMSKYNVAIIEQPVHADFLDGMAEVVKRSNIPIMADESAHTLEDVMMIAEKKAADVINIKLIKAGGIIKAKQMAELADVYGIPCQIGGVMYSSILASAARHVAAGTRNIVFYEGGKPAEFLGYDPVDVPLKTERGKGVVSEGHGLGVTFKSPKS